MIVLKELIHYQATNSVEATWVDRTITPCAEVPEVPAVPEVLPTYDENGVMLTPGSVAVPAVPAYTPPDVVTDVQIKCHSYADVQMQMLRDDAAAMNTSLAEHEALIATVEAAIVVLTPEELAQQRVKQVAQVCEQIKTERDRRKDGGTLVAGKWFHSDRDSRIQQLGLVMMGAAVPGVQWKTMDGSYVTMTQTLAMGIFQATATLDMTLFAVAQAHQTAVAASTNPSAYDFSAGWPAHFEE